MAVPNCFEAVLDLLVVINRDMHDGRGVLYKKDEHVA